MICWPGIVPVSYTHLDVYKRQHEEHLSVLDFKKQERSKEVAALEAAKQECQTDLTEMQEQLETCLLYTSSVILL